MFTPSNPLLEHAPKSSTPVLYIAYAWLTVDPIPGGRHSHDNSYPDAPELIEDVLSYQCRHAVGAR